MDKEKNLAGLDKELEDAYQDWERVGNLLDRSLQGDEEATLILLEE